MVESNPANGAVLPRGEVSTVIADHLRRQVRENRAEADRLRAAGQGMLARAFDSIANNAHATLDLYLSRRNA